MLLQFIPLRIYKFCLFQFSPRLIGSPNVHSTLRSMNREGFSRRSSTVGPGFITMKPKISRYAYRQGNSSRKFVQQNLDEAFCTLKVADVLIEKTLRKYNSLKYNHARIQKVMSEAGGPVMAQHRMLAW